MTADALQPFREIWCVDFEYRADPGERPVPLCVVAREWRSGRLERHWLTEGTVTVPYPIGPDTLFVAFLASAEIGCHLALGWPTPARVLDLFVEFRNLTNGRKLPPHGNSLLGVMAYYGLPRIDVAEKKEMVALALRPGPHSKTEQAALLEYCQTDVDALVQLLPAMLPRIDLPRAVFRGRYMSAAANMEAVGVPIDTQMLARLLAHWPVIKANLIDAIDPEGEIYVPTKITIDPQTGGGAAVIETASEHGIDKFVLAAAADFIDKREREILADLRDALKAAREETGITAGQAGLWEDRGRDSASWPQLDVRARSLAGRYPVLGIGQGYTSEGGYDDTDYAGLLWDRLRQPDPKLPRKHSPERLREAAELVAQSGNRKWSGERSFNERAFRLYLARRRIPWPRLESGALDLEDKTFKDMARLHPEQIGPIRELRHALSKLRLNGLAVGADGRNRCVPFSPFASVTSRNQPSNSKFIFGPAVWLRSLIHPDVDRAIAYADWSGQEYGIAAALSGDANMQADYQSGDPYLAFGKRIGAVPPDATKKTHGADRDRLKICCGLGAMYGAGERTVAAVLGVPRCQAREWLRLHRTTYLRYWEWSDSVLNHAMLTSQARTCFGWTIRVGTETKPGTVRNFPMQAHGAEMMRLAACLATERGVMVCAPVHDAFLIESADDEIDVESERMASIMREASELVLPGFPLRTDAKIVRHPDRYSDPRGAEFWDRVCGLLAVIEAANELDVSPYSSSEDLDGARGGVSGVGVRGGVG